jgi:hypothetical protein
MTIKDINQAFNIMSVQTQILNKAVKESYSLSTKILQEETKDKTCPECGREMNVERKVKGKPYKSPVDIYKCKCGYECRKRTMKEILRDLGEIE